ncbi:dUTP diphosphatase [Salmonella bongori]|uniref:dUTP diphosphatase n=4 Tax=Salmonella TaxID=590 RepID=A0A750KKQ3_SALER|nr:dUTP diphosphatase [Salmonella bongori serovar 66:z41:- str. SA19983605]ECC8731497.1 dUTP diphosphatase [Salmonella bongori]ECG8257123.1 dUTP diphosphatase [Salmonella bongori serovar 48:i:-]EGE4654352.1 dUTP diphosphatase [Salmonella bongori serovar 40:z35:- str. 95-0123]EGE4657017.1 dUTP diphosphatase [Salmonella bongori serovar 48:i:- str. 94-0708]EGS1128905.1 dUTP diphosphatase [Salmonella bongori CFSAN000509]TNB52729.1 dUTP diphosphatase [Salmonella bongori serovar 48:z35:-]HAC669303
MVNHPDITFFPAAIVAGVKRKILCLKIPPFPRPCRAGSVPLYRLNL